ncbi:DUF4237 domain-containing protein [Amycolatopsis acidicola]|uniref:DUF4237 domain-containing protein n=1 Tax=Amycolatopsis acidicola TaxID=2596893 RepID=A0A5N0VJY0_9PSEU|nr:TNT domain-containing protein [Amycolatopsis acidicola]KAA9166687.1 DUF4237 domain-containing protein [Amycolatopsis acidicola]
MRYRVELAERPDGLFAVWRGRVFQAQRSTEDRSLLLVAPRGEEPPEEADTEWDARPAKVIGEDEVESTFSLQTHCLFADEIFRIVPDGETLALQWNGHDEQRAKQLGLAEFTTSADPDEITALWQERHDFAGGIQPEAEEPEVLVRAIARAVRAILPGGWERVAAQFRQVGAYSEVEVRAVGEGYSVSLPAPPEVGQLFSSLRAAMYQPENGTWFKGTLTLEAPSSFQFDYDMTNEPAWRQPPEAERLTAPAYEAELARFPRERSQVPDWLAEKAGLTLGVKFRQASLPEQPQPLPPQEVRPVLDYLYRAPVVLTRPGTLPDAVNAAGPADVPDAFHTDGLWIWPAAVPHYLRKYGLPPEAGLLERIRSNNYRVPFLSPRLRATAEAEVLGKPHPPAFDRVEVDPVTVVDRGGEPALGLRASEVLVMLQRRLTEYGIPESAYRLGEVADGAWCLQRVGAAWEVSGPGGEPLVFPHIEAAARFLLGSLLMYPARAGEGPDVEWPIAPMRGEPPLNFFRAKRMVLLPAGATVLRFGHEQGNLVHEQSTRFPEASLTPDREQPQQRFRLTRPLPALTGVTQPWGPMPGGGLGYFLPHSLAQYLENGAVERVQ